MSEQRHNSEASVKAETLAPASEGKAPGQKAEKLNMDFLRGSKTPPSQSTKKTILVPDTQGTRQKPRSESQPVDPDALARALKEYDEAGRRRERTPGTSPSRKRQRVYGDR
jgi:cell division cycle 20-like protein 1, cofactor of APC complex